MNNKDKNIIDRFLDDYEAVDTSKDYQKVYRKPSKGKSISLFIVCIIFLILLILFMGFSFNMVNIVLYGGDLVLIIYYGINAFTKKGFVLPKYEKIKKKIK